MVSRMTAFTGSSLPSGKKGLSEEDLEYIKIQKAVRKELKLPVTKKLVFYQMPVRKDSKPIDVGHFFVAAHSNYDTGMTFYVCYVLNENGMLGVILSDNFAEMQSPNYVNMVNEVIEEE